MGLTTCFSEEQPDAIKEVNTTVGEDGDDHCMTDTDHTLCDIWLLPAKLAHTTMINY